jgi:hypothetical protein
MNLPAWLLALSITACVGAEPERAPLSARTLLEYCTVFQAAPESEAGYMCIGYVRGLVDGLSAARWDHDGHLTWSERAAQTRLGRGYRSRLTMRTGCLDDPDEMSVLIMRVLDELRSASPEESSDARQLVLRIISEQSPCAA